MELTLRISSRSSLNASATDAIQNFLNRSFNTLSSSCGSDEDKNCGIAVGGGVGEGVRRGAFRDAASDADWGAGFLGSDPLSESESGSEEDDDDEESSLDCGFS